MFLEEHEGGQSLTARVFHQLKDDILLGKYKTKESLTETRAAKELGVSRTPVREAIRLLEFEGLVTTTSRGAVVEGITAEDIEDIYAIRALIEGLAARRAVEKMTEAELIQLEETVELMEFYRNKNDVVAVIRLDTRFHEIIYRSCKSRPLLQVLMNFHDLAQRVRVSSIKMDGRLEHTIAEHQKIAQALRERDAAAAEAALTNHVFGVIRNLDLGVIIPAQGGQIDE